MRAAVRDAWIAFTEPLEGGVPYLYADVRGLVTIAYGNLADPMSAALALPLMHPGGTRATTAEIASAWQSVKNDPAAPRRGHTYARGLTSLRLTREGMSAIALAKLDANDRILRARLPTCWEDLGACAQMALHSLAWACGANAHFPRLFEDVARGDFEAAAVEIHMNEWTPEGVHNTGIVPRNAANRILMLNAARVRDFHLDPDALNWTSLIGVHDAPTLPDLTTAATHPTVAPEAIIHAIVDTVSEAQRRDE